MKSGTRVRESKRRGLSELGRGEGGEEGKSVIKGDTLSELARQQLVLITSSRIKLWMKCSSIES